VKRCNACIFSPLLLIIYSWGFLPLKSVKGWNLNH